MQRDIFTLLHSLISGGGQVVFGGVGQARLGQQVAGGRAGRDDLLRPAVRRDLHGVGTQHLQQHAIRRFGGDKAVILAQRGHARLRQHSGGVLVDRDKADAAAVGIADRDKMQRRRGKGNNARQRRRTARQRAPLGTGQRHTTAEMLFCFYG